MKVEAGEEARLILPVKAAMSRLFLFLLQANNSVRPSR
jgi:hypothetical protein